MLIFIPVSAPSVKDQTKTMEGSKFQKSSFWNIIPTDIYRVPHK